MTTTKHCVLTLQKKPPSVIQNDLW